MTLLLCFRPLHAEQPPKQCHLQLNPPTGPVAKCEHQPRNPQQLLLCPTEARNSDSGPVQTPNRPFCTPHHTKFFWSAVVTARTRADRGKPTHTRLGLLFLLRVRGTTEHDHRESPADHRPRLNNTRIFGRKTGGAEKVQRPAERVPGTGTTRIGRLINIVVSATQRQQHRTGPGTETKGQCGDGQVQLGQPSTATEPRRSRRTSTTASETPEIPLNIFS